MGKLLLFGVLLILGLQMLVRRVESGNALFSQVLEEDFDNDFALYNTTSGLYLAETIELDGYEFEDGLPMLVHRYNTNLNAKRHFK